MNRSNLMCRSVVTVCSCCHTYPPTRSGGVSMLEKKSFAKKKKPYWNYSICIKYTLHENGHCWRMQRLMGASECNKNENKRKLHIFCMIWLRWICVKEGYENYWQLPFSRFKWHDFNWFFFALILITIYVHKWSVCSDLCCHICWFQGISCQIQFLSNRT